MEKTDSLINNLLILKEFDINFDDEIKQTILYPTIEILKKKVKEYPELNFDKILLIALILLDKLNSLQIRTIPEIVIYTSTILWHNALNQVGEKEYFLQDSIKLMFDRSLTAVRYLRQELGITERKYYNIEHFIKLLRKAIPLKKQKDLDYLELAPARSNAVKEIIANQIIGRIKAKSAIECSTFLYLNEKPHSKNEIWYAIEKNFHLEGSTPRASFNSDISRYCDNSNTKNKRKPLLFTIVNLEKREYKIILKRDIRIKIDKFLQINSAYKYSPQSIENLQLEDFKEKSNDILKLKQKRVVNLSWNCPKDSCGQKKIGITRNKNNIIDGNTYQNIIIHFLQHLRRNNEYFGSIDIYSIFQDNSEEDIFSEQDLSTYPDYGRGSTSIKWKNQVRSALNHMTRKGYFETVDRSLVPTHCNIDITDKRLFRTRKRTKRFFQSFELYDDWELYEVPTKSNGIHRESSDEVINVISNKLGKTVNVKVEGVEFIFQGRGAYAILNYFNDRFILIKKSIVTKMYAEYFPEKFSGLFNLRKKLIENGILEKRTDDKYNLMKNLEFRSPSPCACFCAGASLNGYTAFKLKTNRKITLKEYITKSEITKKVKLELEPTKKDEGQKIDNIHLLSTHNLGPLSSVIYKLKYYDFNERFTVEDLLSVNSELEQEIFQSLIVNFLKLLENPLINGVKQNTKGEYRLVANTNKIINKINDISLVLQNSLNKNKYEKLQKIDQKSEVEHIVEEPKAKPIILAIYKDNIVMSKNDIEYFIPEILVYLSNGDQSLTRGFFKSEAYKWRRKFQILNINNEEKIKIYFDQLKSLSLLNKINLKLSDVNLIIDLNEHKLYYIDGGGNFDGWKDIPFSYFKIQALDDIAFKNLLDKIYNK